MRVYSLFAHLSGVRTPAAAMKGDFAPVTAGGRRARNLTSAFSADCIGFGCLTRSASRSLIMATEAAVCAGGAIGRGRPPAESVLRSHEPVNIRNGFGRRATVFLSRAAGAAATAPAGSFFFWDLPFSTYLC